ncbi:aminoglycoside 3-N-acetyltransferase [Luteitalea sp. TBR-22]|uniref:aminoglycoside N(3)-acetyltransferase n=1 Tax=Luteitalea sp. TBR-22 TaxID=2802971 RepID=UPI001AFC1A0E|nr:AAC(3) family N-acetyltransferase [Luteitalea sp. TBR-22]BCS35642.1 aminoglycoside 3-N-acetyltransferase [Luteitalea sp. TBR-22]
MFSRSDLVLDARALGIREGDLLMIHASVRAVGPVIGGPDQIHLALKDAVGDDGSLFMYASCPAYYDEVGRGDHAPEVEARLLEALPAFDPATARSARDNGALVELLRTWPGTVANDHVVRFVCRGPHAAQLFAPQAWNYAYGDDSPLARFAALGGRILLLGSDHDQVTFLHHAEHLVDVPGKRVVRYEVPRLVDGQRVWTPCEEFDTSEPAHPAWPEDFFRRITDAYLARTGNAGGRIGLADCWVMDAEPLKRFALEVMRALVEAPEDAAALLAGARPR